MLYADDILIFAEASTGNVETCKAILADYCCWTGQSVNHAKSAILFSKAILSWKRRRLTRRLGVPAVSELDYLGVKLSLSAACAQDFAPLMEKAAKTVSNWGVRHLSTAGRATLISSSLLSLPMYLLSHTEVPSSVTNFIEKLGRKFLWQKTSDGRGTHYIAWDKLCCPSSVGGLGFHSAAMWKGPLRARLAWDYMTNPTGWLHRVLFPKYGQLLSDLPLRRGDSDAWRVLLDGAKSLRSIIKWNVGDGSGISTVADTWIGDLPLARWPTTVNLEAVEGTMVADFRCEGGVWNVDRLVGAFGTTLGLRIADSPSCAGADSAELLHSVSGKTVSAQAYEAIFGGMVDRFGWLKNLKLHPRERLFWRRLLLKAIPTAEWLATRGLAAIAMCPWGCGQPEDANHVAFGCLKVREVMTALKNWGVRVAFFDSVDALARAAVLSAASDCFGIRLFAYAVYQCWRARNAKLHGQPFASPTVMAAHILDAVATSFNSPITDHWDTNQPNGLTHASHWCPPPPDWIKFNVDGALSRDNNAGVGVVVRGSDGCCISASGSALEHWDSGAVEMQAIHAIKEATRPWMFGLKGAIIEGDNSNVIKLCRSSIDAKVWRARPPDAPDLTFLSQFSQVIFNWVPRSANRAADFCAKSGKICNFFWDFDAISSPELLEFLQADLEGVAFL